MLGVRASAFDRPIHLPLTAFADRLERFRRCALLPDNFTYGTNACEVRIFGQEFGGLVAAMHAPDLRRPRRLLDGKPADGHQLHEP